MTTTHLVALALILAGVAVLTAIVWLVVRAESALVARHVANLALPLALAPLVAALLLVGDGAGAGVAVLILLLQLVSGTTESHLAGFVHWRQDRRRGEHPPRGSRSIPR